MNQFSIQHTLYLDGKVRRVKCYNVRNWHDALGSYVLDQHKYRGRINHVTVEIVMDDVQIVRIWDSRNDRSVKV